MEKVNELVLTREDHGDKLFEVMGEAIKVLVNSGYVCKVRADEPGLGIYVIEYASNDPELTTVELVWIDSERQYVIDADNGGE